MSSKLVPQRRARRALLFVLTLIAGLLGIVSHSVEPAASQIYSDWCADGWPPGAPQTDVLTWPIRVGVEIVPVSNALVCYSTTPTGVPLAGGAIGAGVTINPSSSPSVGAGADCLSDTGMVIPVWCHASTGPSVTSYGDGTYAVAIPFSVCVSGCVGGTPAIVR